MFLTAVVSIMIAAVLLQKTEGLTMQNGWYEIHTAEDYRLFWEMVADGRSDLNGRLMKDIKLNDLKDREDWHQVPPQNDSIEVEVFRIWH